LDYLPVNRVYVLQQWKVVLQGLSEIAQKIKIDWFEGLI
jgi:hypothetical protein